MPQDDLPPPPAPKKGTPPLDYSQNVIALSGRIRVMEERYSELRKKLLVVEQNMLTHHKKAMTELKALQSDFLESKRTMMSVEDKIITIIKELRLTARKEDIDVMKRYIELWDPVKFVTSERVEKLIDERLAKPDKPPRYDSP